MADFAQEQLDSRILIVDDVPSARKVVKRLLEKMGFSRIEEAANGEAAFERAAKGDIDVILSDWDMPVLNGIELLAKLRSELKDRRILFLMITGSSAREQVLQAGQQGVSDYIVKPFSGAALSLKLQTLLSTTAKSKPA